MCQDLSAQNVDINKGVLRMCAFGADVINSRNITPEARQKAEVKLLNAKKQVRTSWCGNCGDFVGKTNGLCVKCTAIQAAEYQAREARNG